MKVLTITLMILRLAVLVALIFGILFWLDIATNFIPIHMLIGIIVVLSLWIIGLVQGFMKGGSLPFAVLTFVLGLALAIVGLYQQQWLVGSAHWIIQVIHLLLGLSAIAVAEMIVGRTKRRVKAQQVVS
ncbi:MAG TPA: hypothetical protein VEU97_15135 [Ktedonobacteraceae bacterium]|nr:hypothetical protein [Ktedonobacteraceae bacterium]